MCGIAGIAEKEEVVDPATILSMTQEIRHRGPDDEGYLALNLRSRQVVPLTGQDSQVPGTQARQFRDPANLYLGHRRLSILDTSSDGHQPMASEDKKIWLVFNGEIYNYIEIRDELISYGHAFKTKTDTEVLLKAYQHWGADCVTHFNGMWAFVILDLQKNNLFGSRDRFGVKPLYYHYKEGAQFLFASEIKALHASGKIPVSFNDSAIFDYLSFGWQETESEGFFKDILELQPSHSFTFSLQSYQLKVWSYYSLPMNQTWEDFNPKKEQHHIDKIKSLLQDSIQKRLRSDVLVGSCLSGGLDSSSIVCYINILLKKNTSLSTGASQNVYTACFDDPRIDESHYAKLVVDQTQTTWHQSTPKSDELLADLGDLIRTQEIPFSSTSIYSQYRIMKLAKETGVKVLMDGQGGDEVFGGYKAFYRGFFSEMLHKGDWGRLMSEWSHLDNAPISHRDLIKSQFLQYATLLCPPKLLPKILKWRENEYRYIQPEFWKEHAHRLSSIRERATCSLNQMLWNYMTGLNLKSLLRYEDRNSMRFGIEARTPFADDTPLIEYLFNLPSSFKIYQGWSKYLLRQAVAQMVPPQILERKDKVGFVTPEHQWLCNIKKELLDFITPTITPYIKTAQLKKEWDTLFNEVDPTNTKALWRLINLSIWMDQYGK